jgi:hypothetical protein
VADFQIPGGPYVNETGAFDALVPGSAYLNQTASGASVIGGIDADEQRDVAAFDGDVVGSVTGTLASTEARDLAAFTGIKVFEGSFTVIEARDIAAFTGDVFLPNQIVGALDADERRDIAAFSGAKVYDGALAADERRDLAAFPGTNQKQIDGTLATLEGFDLAAFEGNTFLPGQIVGRLAAPEFRDTVAFDGEKVYEGAIGAVETLDRAAFSGINQKEIAGDFAATEPRDIAFFTDSMGPDEVSNTIAIRDGNAGIGISPEAEWKDGPPTWARGAENGEIQFPMAIGQPSSADNFSNNATNRQMRLLQALSDTPAGTDILPGWFAYIDVKAGQWIWCVSRTSVAGDSDNPIGKGDVAPV